VLPQAGLPRFLILLTVPISQGRNIFAVEPDPASVVTIAAGDSGHQYSTIHVDNTKAIAQKNEGSRIFRTPGRYNHTRGQDAQPEKYNGIHST
jgi:hypothetical protein